MASPQIEKEPAIATIVPEQVLFFAAEKNVLQPLAFRTNFSYTNIIAYFRLSTKDCDQAPY